MKEMEIKNRVQMSLAMQEAEMLKDIVENITHPHIMQIEKIVQIGSRFYLIFPLCKGGELYEHVVKRGHFTELDAAKIIRDLVSALAALHRNDIMHLDIKPENILMQSSDDHSDILLTDFGLSRKFKAPQADEKPAPTSSEMHAKLRDLMELGSLHKDKLRGTVGYMSPELILCGYSCKATDVFSVGVVLFILLSGRPPFHSKSHREVNHPSNIHHVFICTIRKFIIYG